MCTIRILLADDFLPWHRIIQEIVRLETDLKIIAKVTDGVEAVEKAAQLQPDVVLLELRLPRMHGLRAAEQIQKCCAASKIVFLSNEPDQDLIKAAFRQGALGYISKNDVSLDLVACIRSVLRNEPYVSRSLRRAK